MHGLANRVYMTIHTTPWLADFVYSSARHLWRVRYWFRHKFAERFKVSAKELFKYRSLEPGSCLHTAVTNICNAKCVFCAYPKAVESGNLKTGVMSFDMFKKAADEWAKIGGGDLDLTPTVGDTLVDPGLIKKIDYAVNVAKIPKVVLTTNGILLNRNDFYKKLVDGGVKEIYISTQGTDPEVYKKIYGVDHYDEYLSGLKNLLEYNRSKGEPVFIGIRFRNAQTPGEIIRSRDFQEALKPYLGEKVRINFTVDYDNWGGTIKEEDLSGFMKMRKLPSKIDVPCVGLFSFVVRHDGQVRMCGCRFRTTDADDMVVGNLKEQSLEEIANSDRSWKIVDGFYNGKRPETCEGCTLYQPVTQKWFKSRVANADAYHAAAKAKSPEPLQPTSEQLA
jgi:radical SAM protein with 4Fe4S-binding SPASM domain